VGWAVASALATGLAVLVAWSRPSIRLQRDGPLAGLDPARARRLRVAVPTAVLGLVVGLAAGWWSLLVAVLAGLGGYVAAGRLHSAEEAARGRALAASVPGVCDLLAVCLDAGLPLRNATAELGRLLPDPAGGLLAQLSATVGLGTDEATAWRELAAAEPSFAELGRELARSLDFGLTATAALRVIGERARRAQVSRVQQRARRVGVSSVLPLVLCLLPSFVLIGVVPIIGGVVQRFLG